MANPLYNLSLQEAIVFLESQVEKNRKQTETGVETEELQGMSLDQAYDVGYETLLHDLKSVTGPDPMEVSIVHVPIPLPIETPKEEH
jgi:hypothetical protein